MLYLHVIAVEAKRKNMKRILSSIAVAMIFVASVSCTKSDVGRTSATAETLDATDVSFKTFTLNAVFTIKGDGNTPCKYGILVGTEPGLTYKTGIFTSNEYVNDPGTYEYSYIMKNVVDGLVIPWTKFLPGQEVFYRAAIELVGIDESKFVYGEEKSLVVPLK